MSISITFLCSGNFWTAMISELYGERIIVGVNTTARFLASILFTSFSC